MFTRSPRRKRPRNDRNGGPPEPCPTGRTPAGSARRSPFAGRQSYRRSPARRRRDNGKRVDDMFQAGLFAGKKILVTGGGTGLGRGMAERLLGLGAEIAICGRRKSVCDAAAEAMMTAHGGAVKSYGVDIRDAGAVEAMVEEIFRAGSPDVADQQRRGKFHRAHRGFVAARLRRYRQHRHARDLLCHPGGGQAMDRGRPSRQRRLDRRDLGPQRRAVCRAVGDEQGGGAGDDDVACGGVGSLRHPPQRDRARRNPDRGHEQAPLAGRRTRGRGRRRRTRSAASGASRSCRIWRRSCSPTAASS